MSRRRVGGAAPLAALLACALCFSTAPAAEKQPPAKPIVGPKIEARSWALIDARTGDVIVSHAGARHLSIASTTKLMTAYVALKEEPLDKIVRGQPYEPEYGESLMGLRVGQKISIRDLLYGLILRSGNDAANTLAIDVAGSVPRFVAEMNRYAAALGLSDTHYANPVGLDQKGNYSSALDLATLTQHLLRIPAFAKIANSESAELESVRPKRRITTINELLSLAPWINGVKTGHTFGALYVLVGSGRRKGVELISDAIGAPSDEDRFSDNLELLDYGFRQYKQRLPIHAGQDLADPSIRYSGGELPLRAARPLAVGLRRGQTLSLEVRAPHEVRGPIRRGAVLGHATVFVDGLRAGAVALRAGRSIPKASAFDRARGFVGDHPIPIALAVFVILMGALFLYRRLSRRTNKRNRTG
ncbi:MAG: D-alanyl-D-alanine carboxypeptidase [Solirubrobacterales bacterium]|nr:D-alanyl-D-alanine carboxypeptidase [Solirubrobacterales bacterium]